MTPNDRPQPDASTTTADLATDLRVLTGLRSRTAVRDRVLPALDAHLGGGPAVDREARFAALQELIDTSIDRMTDPAHRHAAAELLGSGPYRWQPLTRRGPRASSAFQLGWDAYRRRRETTGASLLDDTLDALAATIVDRAGRDEAASPHPDLTPPTNESHPDADAPIGAPDEREPATAADRSTGTVEGPARSTPDAVTRARPSVRISRATVAAVAIAVVVLAVAVVLATRPGSDDAAVADEAEAGRCGAMNLRPGDAAPGAPEELTAWSERFRAAAADQVPDVGCASAIGTRDGSIFQVVAPGGSDVTWLLLAPPAPGDDVIVLNPHEHQVYRATVWAPGRAVPHGPAVARLPDRDDGLRTVQLANGVLVQRHEDDRPFVVVDRFHELWLDHGGHEGDLGPPVSDRYERPGVGSTQDFERGSLVAPYTGEDVVRHAARPVDPGVLTNLRGNILRTPSGDTWYVTPSGERRWLPTGPDLTCARESQDAEVIEVDASALPLLPSGPVMRCL